MIRFDTRLMTVLVSAGLVLCACSPMDDLQAEGGMSDLAATATAAGLPLSMQVGSEVNQTAVAGAIVQTRTAGEVTQDEVGEEIVSAAPTVIVTVTSTSVPPSPTPEEAGEEVVAQQEEDTPEPPPADTEQPQENEDNEEPDDPEEDEVPCFAMRFVADVTVPDGTVMRGDQSFFKIWRVQNVGSCTWAADYTIRYHGGFQLGAPSSIELGQSVAPGQYVNIGLQMYSPAQGGSFHGDWIMVSSSGDYFGIGENYDEPFYVEIVVSGSSY